MTGNARHRRVADLFHRALALSDRRAREALLNADCGDDAQMRQEVESLLAAHGASDGFLDCPPHDEAGELIGARLAAHMHGQRLGDWRIDRLLHRGGMGAVYLAHRENADFEQSAALKLIRAGLEDDETLARFARERRVLAQLNHPGIARLLDGGATEEGLPFLVMEYVEGMPIDQWCESRRLTVEQRLTLFRQVCAAVHYAHQNLVIHRDIKPSNILVTPDGMPKLLDFGIAKLLSDDIAGTGLTMTRRYRLTPGYASPEQFLGRHVSTASDVYSLGVLLYQLLTGVSPYDLGSAASMTDAERAVCRDMPTAPSQRLTRSLRDGDGKRHAQLCRSSAERLRRRLRGDLDLIVMKALRKEPARRYRSVDALAWDLDRFAQGLTVSARPDSWRYRARRFTTRHWKSLGAVASVFLALGLGLSTALWQAGQARAERDRTEQVNRFLQTILAEADPYEAGADATVRDVLRKAGELVSVRFGGQPDLEAAVRRTVGYTQLGLMDLEASAGNLERAHELNLALYGPDDSRSVQTATDLGWLRLSSGDYAAAEAIYRDAVERLTTRVPEGLRARLINDYSLVLSALERYPEAARQLEQALAIWQRLDPEHPELATAEINLGGIHHGLYDMHLAERHYRRGLALIRARDRGDGEPDLAHVLNNLGVLLRDQGRDAESLPLFEEALAVRQRLLGHSHTYTGRSHMQLARALMDVERPEQAAPHLRAAMRIALETLPPDHPQVLTTRALTARLTLENGDAEAAAVMLAEVRQALAARAGPPGLHVPVDFWHADALLASGRPEQARAVLQAVDSTLASAAYYPPVFTRQLSWLEAMLDGSP